MLEKIRNMGNQMATLILLSRINLQMGKGFKIVCTDFDSIFEKRGKLFKGGNIIQGRILIKEIP